MKQNNSNNNLWVLE